MFAPITAAYPLRKAVLLALYGATSFALAPAALAQTGNPAPAAVTEANTPLQSVTVVGSRRATSSSTDTVVPVDLIPLNKLAEQGGQFDLSQTLTNISPSFNSTRQSGADGADLVDSAALRGLGSDQTLVLVNG
ncbi:MAG: TonB-dependent receptor, partial [Duganella sp.]